MEQEIVINIIGTGYDINIGEFPKEIWATLTQKPNNAVTPAMCNKLFELDFYRKNTFYKNNNIDTIYSWKDINDSNAISGPNMVERSQIEIWINGKRKKTLKFPDLFPENVLFPFYTINEELLKKENTNHLIIGHQLKGLLSKYIFRTNHFSMDLLQFTFLSFEHNEHSFKILKQLTYKNEILKEDSSDAVVTGILMKIF